MKRRWFGVLLTLFASLYPLLALAPAEAASPTDPGGLRGSAWYDGKPCQDGSRINIDGRFYDLNGSGGFDTGKTLYPGNKSITVTCNVDGTAHTFTNSTKPSGERITVLADQVVDAGQVQGTVDSNDTAVDCNAGSAFSWVICGLIKVAVEAVDAIRVNVIVPFLRSTPLDEKQEEFKAAYALWSAFRNISSIFFILVFFMIIIGTAAGFDSYTVKKIMPHLVAGAILIPFSWEFCAFIIDIGNVVGLGIVSLVTAALSTSGATVEIDLTSSFTAIFLGGLGVAGGFALLAGAAPIGMGVIFSVLIAFIGVFLTLIFRKIMIMIAVILSPLAILAWVLPNTSKWFSEWWKMFFKLVMMYPIIILLFEAGRIFSATAGSTYTSAVGADWVTPLFQIMGLILPLFMVPFAFKFAGKGLTAGSGAISKFTGGLDKKFGKDSDGAKMAAKNRQAKSALKQKEYEGKLSPTRLGKMKNAGMARLHARRAGAPKPFSSKADGFMSNPAKLLANEEMVGAGIGMLGKAASIDEKKKQNIPGETAAQRLQAETQMALNQKIDGQKARQGLVRNADELGEDGLALHNQAILEEGADRTRLAQKEKGAAAMGYNIEAARNPLDSDDIVKHAKDQAEEKELHARATIKGELDAEVDMTEKIIRDHSTPGNQITPEMARAMRLKNLASSTATKAENKLIEQDKEALVQTQYSAAAVAAEKARQAAHGNIIDDAQANRNRLDHYYAAETSKGVYSKLEAEQDAMTFNETEQAAGGRLNGMDVMAAARANNRQKFSDERAKRETGAYGDKLSTSDMVESSRYGAAETFGKNEAKSEAQLIDMKNQAHLDHIPLTTPAGKQRAYEAAAKRTFEANAINGSEHLATASGQDRAAINAAAVDATANGQTPGTRAANVHAAETTTEAARISKEQQLIDHYADEEAVIDTDRNAHVPLGDMLEVRRDEKARQLTEKASTMIGTANQLKSDIQAEVDATGVSRNDAADAVRGRRLENVKAAGLIQGELKAQKAVDAEASTATTTEKVLAAEEARIASDPSLAPGTTADQIAAQARANIVKTGGTAAGLEASQKTSKQFSDDQGVVDDLNTDINKAMKADASLTRDAAKAAVIDTRTSNALTADRSAAARTASKQTGKQAGIAKEVRKNIQKELKRSGGASSDAYAVAQAATAVRERELEGIGGESNITSARSHRTEVDKATGTVESVKAKTEENYKELRKTQAQAMAAAGIERADIKTIMAANKQFDLEKAEDTTFESIQEEAGEAARIAAQDTQAQLMGRDKGVVIENQANLDQAPVERARNEAIRSRYEKEQQKIYDAAYNDSIAAGQTPETAKAAGEAAQKDDKNLLKVRKLADKAGDVARQKTLKDVKAGRINENEKLQNKIVSVERAAQEQAIRVEANTQGSIIGMNQAASAPGALTAAERLASKSTSAAVTLASESGNERAQLEMAGEGQTYHRSYATAEEAQTRAKQEQILRERVDQAGQKMITFKKDGETITDKISNVDLSNEAADAMVLEIENYKNLKLGPDDVAARIRSLGRSSYGADKLRGIKNDIFGGHRGRTVDPEAFDGQAKTIWDIGIAGINRDGNPDLFVPEVASFDGINVEKLAKMNDRTKGVLMDYAEDMAKDGDEIPGKKLDSSGRPTRAREDFAQNVGNSIADIFKNQNTSKNVSLKDLKVMGQKLFNVDAQGRILIDSRKANSAILQHLEKIPGGEEALNTIANKLVEAKMGVRSPQPRPKYT